MKHWELKLVTRSGQHLAMTVVYVPNLAVTVLHVLILVLT
jgi:hypothetical protein